jgi:hypothetical protein
MGAGWRPVLVVVGEPSDPQYQVPEFGSHRSRDGAPVDAGADDVEVVSDGSPFRPGLAGCVGRAVQLRADRWVGGVLLGSFGEAVQDQGAGVAGDR